MVLNEFVAFQQLGSMISSMDYRTGMICAISPSAGFAISPALESAFQASRSYALKRKSTLARLVFKGHVRRCGGKLISAMVVGPESHFLYFRGGS